MQPVAKCPWIQIPSTKINKAESEKICGADEGGAAHLQIAFPVSTADGACSGECGGPVAGPCVHSHAMDATGYSKHVGSVVMFQYMAVQLWPAKVRAPHVRPRQNRGLGSPGQALTLFFPGARWRLIKLR